MDVTIFVATDDRGESNRRGRALFALILVRYRLFAEALFPPVSVSCANTAAPLIHPVTEYARPLLDIKITRLLGIPSADYGQIYDFYVFVSSYRFCSRRNIIKKLKK